MNINNEISRIFREASPLREDGRPKSYGRDKQQTVEIECVDCEEGQQLDPWTMWGVDCDECHGHGTIEVEAWECDGCLELAHDLVEQETPHGEGSFCGICRRVR